MRSGQGADKVRRRYGDGMGRVGLRMLCMGVVVLCGVVSDVGVCCEFWSFGGSLYRVVLCYFVMKYFIFITY